MSAKKKAVREKFRTDVFSRDNYRCKIPECDQLAKDAHHITDRTLMPNGGYVKENGISLCDPHHVDAEEYHITNGESAKLGFHPEDLYRLIGSSYEKAVKASERLT